MSNVAVGTVPQESMQFAIGVCTLGMVLVAQTKHGICAILLGDDTRGLLDELHQRFPRADKVESTDTAYLTKTIAFIDQPQQGFDLPLDIRGTLFQQQVWQVMRSIQSGQTASYTELAQRIGKPKAYRAVAQACAANPLAVAIPCHRVVRSTGALSGYRWGVERKKILLARERQAAST